MKFKLWIAAFLVMAWMSFSSIVCADDQITRETFMAFAKVSGLEKQHTQMVALTVERVKNGIVSRFQMRINQQNIPADLKEKLYPIVRESAENVKAQFEAMFNQEITFDDLVSNVYLPIYRKHFTESELKELIGFYGSPIGIKVSKLVNIILKERTELFNSAYNEKIQTISRDIIEKEMERFKTKLKEISPDNKTGKPERI